MIPVLTDMNSSDSDPLMFTEMYEYEYNSSCDLYTSPESSDGASVSLVLYYLVFSLGLLGNLMVLWVLLRHIKLKTMTDACLLNLTLSDLMLAVTLPLWAYNSQNVALCKMMTGVYQLGLYSGTLFVTLMSVDRYFAIVHAVAAQRAWTRRCAIAASVTIWAVSIILAVPEVVFASLVTDDNSSECQPQYPDKQLQFWKMLRNLSDNTVGLFVSLPIMIFCYVKILVVLSRCRNSKKGRAVKLIFTIVCVFVVCWVPYNIIVFLDTLQQFKILNSCEVFKNIQSAIAIAEIIALSHCCVNPIIYAFIGEKFRNSLGNVLNRYFCCSQRRQIVSHRDTSERDTSNTGLRSDY